MPRQDQPASRVKVDRFEGMVSNANRRDLKPGQSQVQVNVTAVRHGELMLRRGLLEITFDSEDT